MGLTKLVKRGNYEYPRRNCVDKDTPIESKLRDMMHIIEGFGAHPLLTDALNLVSQAKDKVSDYLESDNYNE